MPPTENDASPGENDLVTAIQKRLEGIDSAKYRSNTRAILQEFADWLEADRGKTSLEAIDQLDCRRYAQHLRDRENDPDDALTARSTETYYAYVRAFLSWCVRDGRLESNPAQWNGALEKLPENPGEAERQFWSERDRKALLAFVDRHVDATLDGETALSRERAYRNRALVYLLALSGVRGAEVFSTSQDDRHNGVRWADADLDAGSLNVLGKSREYAQLPKRVCTVLERYRSVSDPPLEDSPIFPTGHAPSKYSAVREQLAAEHDLDADRIENLLEERNIDDIIQEYEVILPSIGSTGARNLMQRLCEAADLDIDGEYLKPHGARRDLGHELYSKGHAELAQSALRHSSIETTHESYSDIRATETARRVDDVLDKGSAGES